LSNTSWIYAEQQYFFNKSFYYNSLKLSIDIHSPSHDTCFTNRLVSTFTFHYKSLLSKLVVGVYKNPG